LPVGEVAVEGFGEEGHDALVRPAFGGGVADGAEVGVGPVGAELEHGIEDEVDQGVRGPGEFDDAAVQEPVGGFGPVGALDGWGEFSGAGEARPGE